MVVSSGDGWHHVANENGTIHRSFRHPAEAQALAAAMNAPDAIAAANEAEPESADPPAPSKDVGAHVSEGGDGAANNPPAPELDPHEWAANLARQADARRGNK